VHYNAMSAESVESFKIGFDVFESPVDIADWFAEIEQIRTVGDDMFDVMLFAEIFEEFCVFGVDWFYYSTAGTFGKNLHGVTT